MPNVNTEPVSLYTLEILGCSTVITSKKMLCFSWHKWISISWPLGLSLKYLSVVPLVHQIPLVCWSVLASPWCTWAVCSAAREAWANAHARKPSKRTSSQLVWNPWRFTLVSVIVSSSYEWSLSLKDSVHEDVLYVVQCSVPVTVSVAFALWWAFCLRVDWTRWELSARRCRHVAFPHVLWDWLLDVS